MKIPHSLSSAFLILLAGLFTYCSGTSQVSGGESNRNTDSVYPRWYSSNQSVTADSAVYRGYATSLAGDSASAARKAIEHARQELMTGISGKLESIRKKAADGAGGSAGLETPGFIVTLRKAETAVLNASRNSNVEVRSDTSHSGYRAFAEVEAEKQPLLSALDDAMARYKTAWNAMKTSQAFSEF